MFMRVMHEEGKCSCVYEGSLSIQGCVAPIGGEELKKVVSRV